MEYDFTVRMGSQNFEVYYDPVSKYGYFEHIELGDNCGGGLWFDEKNNLIDYDGVAVLPREVRDTLQRFNMIHPDEVEDF